MYSESIFTWPQGQTSSRESPYPWNDIASKATHSACKCKLDYEDSYNTKQQKA